MRERNECLPRHIDDQPRVQSSCSRCAIEVREKRYRFDLLASQPTSLFIAKNLFNRSMVRASHFTSSRLTLASGLKHQWRTLLLNAETTNAAYRSMVDVAAGTITVAAAPLKHDAPSLGPVQLPLRFSLIVEDGKSTSAAPSIFLLVTIRAPVLGRWKFGPGVLLGRLDL